MFQIRVWESVFGSTYEEALAAPPQNDRLALTGRSNLLRVVAACDCFPFPPPTPIDQAGSQGFYVVPEPSVGLLITFAIICVGFSRSN